MSNFDRPLTAGPSQDAPKSVQTQTVATIPTTSAAQSATVNQERQGKTTNGVSANEAYIDSLAEQKPCAHLITRKTLTLPPGAKKNVPQSNATWLCVELRDEKVRRRNREH